MTPPLAPARERFADSETGRTVAVRRRPAAFAIHSRVWRRRAGFRELGLALGVYLIYVTARWTAPPRLAHLGITDTVSTGTAVQLTSKSTTLFFNPFAAMPSLHVGFAFAIGLGLAATARGPLLRLIALAWGPAILLTVVVTGNHFVLDAAAGLAVTGSAFLIAGRPTQVPVGSGARRGSHSEQPAGACC